MFRENLTKIIKGIDLVESEMSQMIHEIFSGNITDSQIGAFMAALATKGETFEELAGAAKAMREKAVKVKTSAPELIDIVGTGGDHSNTFNISTTTSFVVAGCGVSVAKHGNRSVSSKCGSADVLEGLGVKLDMDPDLVGKSIDETGIGFLFAPKFHGAMKYAASARKEIGIRSIFNMIGPLSNPADTDYFLLGVYAPELTDMFASALLLLGAKRALVVHSDDGLDEISICSPTRVSELKDGSITTYILNPENYFGEKSELNEIIGGDVNKNIEITRNILSGEKGARRNIVLLNASAALVAIGKAENIKEGIVIAKKSIDSGAASAKLDKLVEFTQGN
ncbi:MAG: anthranilate phosphoribosyltransferase [Desulfobacterales bacterium]|jgi:anthranilate phosphoribosyltransferase|nr:anthranilate phosphoribosyltransferase [Desulfobacteraceae bacterium]MBT4365617.1 anthranilate phosphoribosyltransferase [Desulfobacteraceae bacterium]MBT7086512.1 anthranilate phosphoribosyltransferase [Desulfobacterales bacterium]MBT7696703.1 anthranilate phosphoribosyltransferase [Desulfobacterales bacterium]